MKKISAIDRVILIIEIELDIMDSKKEGEDGNLCNQ